MIKAEALELRKCSMIADDEFRADIFAARTDAPAIPPRLLPIAVAPAFDRFDDDVPVHAHARRMAWSLA